MNQFQYDLSFLSIGPSDAVRKQFRSYIPGKEALVTATGQLTKQGISKGFGKGSQDNGDSNNQSTSPTNNTTAAVSSAAIEEDNGGPNQSAEALLAGNYSKIQMSSENSHASLF